MNEGWAAKVLRISFKRLNPLFLNHVEGFESAALYIANRNCKPNELSLVFRKDGFSICFLNSCLGLKFVSKAGL